MQLLRSARPPASTLTYALLMLLLVSLAAASAETGAEKKDPRLVDAQAYIDAGNPAQALAVLDNVLKRGKPDPEALLLRSTARFMVGRNEDGSDDLRRALELDPTLRQGWLNLAALEVVSERYDKAYKAFLEAEKLDPEAPDNHLNLGAMLLLTGDAEGAEEHFAQYTRRRSEDAEAHFLVASNYALVGQETMAVRYLSRAVSLDERMRMRARADRKFGVFSSPAYVQLMTTDTYQPPADAHQVAAAFEVPYDEEDTRLLDAVIDALGQRGEAFDPKVEVNPEWALIWADMRIKVYSQSASSGVVSLSAPAERFTTEAWHRRSQALFRAVHDALAAGTRTLPRGRKKGH